MNINKNNNKLSINIVAKEQSVCVCVIHFINFKPLFSQAKHAKKDSCLSKGLLLEGEWPPDMGYCRPTLSPTVSSVMVLTISSDANWPVTPHAH